MTYDPADGPRLTRSAELLKTPLPVGHVLDDQLFILAQVELTQDAVVIDITAQTSTVTFDDVVVDAIARQFGETLPTIRQVRAQGYDPRYTLISSGALLWIAQDGQDKLLTLQRSVYLHDDPAKGEVVYPGYFTQPIGRCGEMPSITSLKEMNEEVIVFKDGVCCLFSFEGQTGISVETKQQQLQDMRQRFPDLPALSDEIEIIPLTNLQNPALPHYNIVTRIDGEEVDRFRAYYFLDTHGMTVDMCRTLRAEMPTGAKIECFNVEAPGRTVSLKTRDEILANSTMAGKLLPVLHGYLHGISDDISTAIKPRTQRYIGPLEPMQRLHVTD